MASNFVIYPEVLISQFGQMLTLLDLLITTLKVGTLTYGGGYAMIPVFQHEFVDARAWLTAREFSDGIAVGQITPGPLMLMIAFMGYKIAGVLGALVATLGLFAPSFILVIVFARTRQRLGENALFQSAMKGIGVAVVGLLLAAAVSLARAANADIWLLVIGAVSFALIHLRKVDAVWIIIGAGLIGALIFQ